MRPGDSALVVSVAEPHRIALDREGLSAGVAISVETAMPFGGPLVVRLGRARVAIARRVACGIEVRKPDAAEAHGAPGSTAEATAAGRHPA